MINGMFITGTSTDVGKTFVASRIIKERKDKGIKTAYYKAAASGAYYHNNALVSGDAAFVSTYAKLEKKECIVSFLFEDAYAPHFAAKHCDYFVTIDRIQQDIKTLEQENDLVIIEGTGGIICPLRDDDKPLLLSDVITLSSYPLLIVTPSGLGSINSSVLTAFYASQLHVHVLGFIMNEFEADHPLHQNNKYMIEKLSGYPVLGYIVKNGTEIVKTNPTNDFF